MTATSFAAIANRIFDFHDFYEVWRTPTAVFIRGNDFHDKFTNQKDFFRHLITSHQTTETPFCFFYVWAFNIEEITRVHATVAKFVEAMIFQHVVFNITGHTRVQKKNTYGLLDASITCFIIGHRAHEHNYPFFSSKPPPKPRTKKTTTTYDDNDETHASANFNLSYIPQKTVTNNIVSLSISLAADNPRPEDGKYLPWTAYYFLLGTYGGFAAHTNILDLSLMSAGSFIAALHTSLPLRIVCFNTKNGQAFRKKFQSQRVLSSVFITEDLIQTYLRDVLPLILCSSHKTSSEWSKVSQQRLGFIPSSNMSAKNPRPHHGTKSMPASKSITISESDGEKNDQNLDFDEDDSMEIDDEDSEEEPEEIPPKKQKKSAGRGMVSIFNFGVFTCICGFVFFICF